MVGWRPLPVEFLAAVLMAVWAEAENAAEGTALVATARAAGEEKAPARAATVAVAAAAQKAAGCRAVTGDLARAVVGQGAVVEMGANLAERDSPVRAVGERAVEVTGVDALVEVDITEEIEVGVRRVTVGKAVAVTVLATMAPAVEAKVMAGVAKAAAPKAMVVAAMAMVEVAMVPAAVKKAEASMAMTAAGATAARSAAHLAPPTSRAGDR